MKHVDNSWTRKNIHTKIIFEFVELTCDVRYMFELILKLLDVRTTMTSVVNCWYGEILSKKPESDLPNSYKWLFIHSSIRIKTSIHDSQSYKRHV